MLILGCVFDLFSFLLRLLHLFSLSSSLPPHETDLAAGVLAVSNVRVDQVELDPRATLESDLEGVEKRLVEILAPSLLVRVDKDEVALLVAILRNLVHEDSVVAAREAHREELALQAWNLFDVLGNRSVLVLRVSTLLAVVAILAVSDENDHEFLSFGVFGQDIFDFFEYAHKVGASASLDLVDRAFVVTRVLCFDESGLAVVGAGPELVEGRVLRLEVLFTNQFSA